MSRHLLASLAIYIAPLLAFSQEAFEGPNITRAENDHGPFRSIQRGKLYRVGFGPTLREVIFVYHLGGESPLVVTRNLTGFSEMIRAEVSDIASLRQFVQQDLSHLILGVFDVGERDWFVLTQDSAKWFKFTDAEAKARELVQKLSKEDRAVFDGHGGWTLGFYVIPQDGSVQRWVARGTLYPFSISDVTKSAVEKAGTVPVVPFSG